MALYRTVCLSFWTDPKVSDDFTPEDRYFYLYLFTNPHTNLCGCYEVSIRQMANETGYSKDTIERLITRFSTVHEVLKYSETTKEILLVNWHKYNWTKSEKFRKPLFAEIEKIKEVSFKEYLTKLFNGEEVGYRIDTTCIDTICIDTSVTDTVNSNIHSSSNDITNQSKYITDNTLNTQLIEKPYSEEFKRSIGEWLQYKSEKRQTYKPTGFKQFLGGIDKKLKQYSEQEITDLMHLCMEQNYQGLIWNLMKEVKKSSDGNSGKTQTGEGIYDDFAREYLAKRGIKV